MRLGELRPTRSTEALTLDGPALGPGPGSQLGPAAPLSRAELAIADDSFVVALCTDPASAGDARRFVFFAALLEALHRPVVGLLPEASWNVERATRWVRTAGPRWSFKVLNQPITACWGAIDLGVMIAAPWVLDHDLAKLRLRQTGLVASAHAARTPVLWAGPGQPAELYPGVCAAMLGCESDEPRKLAFKAVSLLEDPARHAEVLAALEAVRGSRVGEDHG